MSYTDAEAKRRKIPDIASVIASFVGKDMNALLAADGVLQEYLKHYETGVLLNNVAPSIAEALITMCQSGHLPSAAKPLALKSDNTPYKPYREFSTKEMHALAEQIASAIERRHTVENGVTP